jgi:hypothetical protein
MRWARHMALVEEKINVRKVLVRTSEVKRQLGKTTDLKEIKSRARNGYIYPRKGYVLIKAKKFRVSKTPRDILDLLKN